jgi:CRP-like cAMP-binding protein
LLEAERLAVLKTIFSCEGASAAALSAALKERHFPNRAVVAHQGDVVDRCWLVVNGVAQLRIIAPDGQGMQLASHGPGEIFGCYPMPSPLRADVLAQGSLHLLEIQSARLADLAAAHADLAAGLAALFARQLDVVLDRMAARTTLSAAGRVYSELLRLAGDENRIEPPPMLSALALNVHTTRETASRAIAHLTRRGIIRRSDMALEILAPRMLVDMVV